MRLGISLLALCFAPRAQIGGAGQPPAQTTGNVQNAPAATPAQDLCTIQGQVFNAATGEPLKKATLNLQRTDLTPDMMSMPATYSTTSDASGKFGMKDLEPGKYRLTVTRNGFVSTTYGARGLNRPGATLSLTRGQQLKDVVFRLTPHGVVAGRVVDEDGEPVPYVRVQLMTYRYLQGRKQLTYANGASTDDLGDYRIFGVAPGKYFVSATATNQNFPAAQDRSATPQPDEDYVPTYYPGTTDAGNATQIEVTPGGQLRDISLRLSKAHTIRVKGHVTYSVAGRQRVTIYLTPRNPAIGGPMSMRPTQADAKGDFDLRGVAPGSYLLTAVINDGSKTYQARAPIDAGGSNVEGVNLTIGPGIEVSGRVRIEGADAADFGNLRLMLQPREPGGMMFGGFSPAKLDDNRAFKLENVSPGSFNLVVTGLPSGFYLKSVRSDQTDVLANGLNTEAASAPLDVVLRAGAAQVAGTVQNPNTSAPSPGATVVLIPQDNARKDQQTYYRQAGADQNGAFTFKDLPPGEYKLYAWEDLEAGAYMDPDFMKPVESKGEALTLRENDQKSVQLTLIPADPPGGRDKE